LRKHQRPEVVDLDSYLNNSLLGYKKPKKELTEDDINKKNEQIQKRKNHAKRQLEEEKTQTIKKILNVIKYIKISLTNLFKYFCKVF
jgi:DNA-binding protein H-NS